MVGLVTFGPNRDCQLSVETARRFRARVDNIGARLVNFAYYLCDEDVCRTEIDRVSLYWDAGHFSAAGSRKVVAATGAGAAIVGRQINSEVGGSTAQTGMRRD